LIFDGGAQFQFCGHSFEFAPEAFLTGLRRMRPHLGGQGPHPQNIFRCAIRHWYKTYKRAIPLR
jgi:hypothetical protein